jgi:Transposase, Mutator family
LLSRHADKLTDDGRRRLVRHGHLPEREIMTGIGPVAVHCPRVRDRGGEACERIRFSSAILPPYARRSKSLEVLIPILYLKGISTGDFEDALIALLGRDAGGLSASTIGRLKEAWSEEHARWSKRDLSAKRYIYFWVDGIHVQARLEDTTRSPRCATAPHAQRDVSQTRPRSPDLQARRGCRKKLASPQWSQPVAENHPRYKVHRWNRGCQIASSNRCRLIPSVTKIRR